MYKDKILLCLIHTGGACNRQCECKCNKTTNQPVVCVTPKTTCKGAKAEQSHGHAALGEFNRPIRRSTGGTQAAGMGSGRSETTVSAMYDVRAKLGRRWHKLFFVCFFTLLLGTFSPGAWACVRVPLRWERYIVNTRGTEQDHA